MAKLDKNIIITQYFPYTIIKEAQFRLGMIGSEFNKLVKNNEIKISKRGGKKYLVNNYTLEQCIIKYGGREERYLSRLKESIHIKQDKLIDGLGKLVLRVISQCDKKNIGKYDYIIKNNIQLPKDIIIKLNKKYNHNDIVKFYHIMKLYKRNKLILTKLYKLGLTDKILEKYYKDENHIVNLNSKNKITILENIGASRINISSYDLFFQTYKSNLKLYKNIDIFSKKQKEDIEEKLRKKLGY